MAKARVAALLIQGARVRDAARAAGVSEAWVQKWRREDEEFLELLADSEQQVIEALQSELVTSTLVEIRDLLPSTVAALRGAIDGQDRRLQMQAAGLILRYAGAMGDEKASFEAKLMALEASPVAGD